MHHPVNRKVRENLREREEHLPSAEEQRRKKPGRREHIVELGHHEEREFGRAVFEMVTGDKFGLAFRQIKRQAVCFRENRGEENQKTHGLNENAPLWNLE